VADTFYMYEIATYDSLCEATAQKHDTKRKKDTIPTFQIELHEPNKALRLSKGEEINPLGS